MIREPRSLTVRLLLLLALAAAFACDDKGNDPAEAGGDPTGSLISHSGCKYGVEATPKRGDDDSSSDGVEWSFADGTLTLTHVNAAGNCCPDSLTAEVTVSNDTIRIAEKEHLTGGGCRCLCLYDREYELKNLGTGAWRIEFDELYVPEGESPLAVDITIGPLFEGERSTVRSDYPWGVKSIGRGEPAGW